TATRRRRPRLSAPWERFAPCIARQDPGSIRITPPDFRPGGVSLLRPLYGLSIALAVPTVAVSISTTVSMAVAPPAPVPVPALATIPPALVAIAAVVSRVAVPPALVAIAAVVSRVAVTP